MQSAVSKRGLIGPPQETYKELCTEGEKESIAMSGAEFFFWQGLEHESAECLSRRAGTFGR